MDRDTFCPLTQTHLISNLAGPGGLFKQMLLLQEIPDATKQAKWDGPKPDKFDWDKEIKRVVEEGKEVPELEWLKPGEDAAWEVGSALSANLTSILPRHRLLFKVLQLPCDDNLPISTRGLSCNKKCQWLGCQHLICLHLYSLGLRFIARML